MSVHLTEHRDGFGPGLTMITRAGEAENDTGIDFGVLKLAAGETRSLTTTCETAWLLMSGTLDVRVDDATASMSRTSLFNESASCIHVSTDETVELTARTDVELTVYATANAHRFVARFFTPEQVPNEHRGKGSLGDACYRFVRTIFDRKNSDAVCNLVLGEVVTHPGKWSSYPPHHHNQPEIYHYRFVAPQGFGHGEAGDDVFRIKNYDTLKIAGGLDHAQCAAPGYGMYYTWVIRHLPNDPYKGPEFTAEHAWTLDPAARYWLPAEK